MSSFSNSVDLLHRALESRNTAHEQYVHSDAPRNGETLNRGG